MTKPAFDTLKAYETLTKSGIADTQTRALLETMVDLFKDSKDDLVTKADLKAAISELKAENKEMENRLRTEINTVASDVKVLKWILTVVVGGIIVLVLKAFFPI